MKEAVVTWRPRRYATKPGINRRDGDCDQLLNTTPMRVSGSEYTRYGYKVPDIPAMPGSPAGISIDFYRYASTELPSAKEVLFLFGQDGGATKYDYAYSWIKAYPAANTTWVDEWVKLNESKLGVMIGGVTGTSDFTFTSSAAGLSTTTDYYNRWIAVHLTGGAPDALGVAYIDDYSESGGTGTFTVHQNIGSDGLGWAEGESVHLYRWNHSNPTFVPHYDTPNIAVREGVFRVNGGKGSTAGNRGLWMGYINRVFFPGETGTFTYQGSYVSERQLKSTDCPTFTFSTSTNATSGIDAGKTYWGAIGCIYDGYQHGPLLEDATGEYDAANKKNLLMSATISPGSLNKRITHVLFYAAQDDGDTTATGRVNPYYEIQRIAIVGADYDAGWAPIANGSWYRAASFDNTWWENRGNSFEMNSGFQMDVDTMFSFDLEVAMMNRQWAARIYDYTQGKEDLDRIYTNPRQNGVVAPDIFALEPDIFVGRVLWGDSSYITGLIPNERGRLIVLKDRAVVDMGVDEAEDGAIQFQPSAISTTIGCASVNGYVNTAFGIFFAGYDDIWKFDGRLSPMTAGVWEDGYRALTTAKKRACIAWFRPEDRSITFQFDGVADTFTHFLETEDWRQTQYAHKMASYTVKRDGTVYWIDTGGNVYLFDTTATDAGTAIPTKFKTGYFRCADAGAIAILRDLFINKNLVTTTGTLDVDLKLSYEGSATTTARDSQDKSKRRLHLRLLLDVSHAFDAIAVEYNTHDTTPETGPIEIGDIEIHVLVEPKPVYA
jgi:hypothetical protein